ncbi:MAG: hypothetical protein GWO20_15000 [Candidatus Korarchaeota archaeon]|nr:hypothetical protein [Candidatus Korarchaeota archaeon]NIU84730.1 hypothetical protein [Candidatus Thorarchaeota archaeon]NIW14732.1 hypothetical protein [Candidatus Thorarchaeota archaeon]NIW52806.1 hypothetical protein [Candidatus Korarchaeota archaeon]
MVSPTLGGKEHLKKDVRRVLYPRTERVSVVGVGALPMLMSSLVDWSMEWAVEGGTPAESL